MTRLRITLDLDDADQPTQVSVTWYDQHHELEGITVVPLGPFDRLTNLCEAFADGLWNEHDWPVHGVQLPLPLWP